MHVTQLGFPGGSEGKASACNVRRPGFYSWVRKIPRRRKWQPTPVPLPGKSHGWRSLVGYSPWSRKESDTSGRLHFLSFFPCSNCRSLIRCSVYKYFLPFCGLSFHSLGSVLQSTEVIVFIKSCLFFFCCHL